MSWSRYSFRLAKYNLIEICMILRHKNMVMLEDQLFNLFKQCNRFPMF